MIDHTLTAIGALIVLLIGSFHYARIEVARHLADRRSKRSK